MRIAFLMNWFDRTNTVKYPRSVGYYMTKHLEQHGAEIDLIPSTITNEFACKMKQVVYKYIFNKRYLHYADLSLIKFDAKRRSKILEKSTADIIFAFGPTSLVFLETDKKVSFWTDAIFNGLLNYYSDYQNLAHKSIINSQLVDIIGLHRAECAFFTSEWAYNLALQENKAKADRYFIAPFGMNLDITHSIGFIEQTATARIKDRICKLLLIGVDWQRKGADIAVAITKQLNKLGINAELTVIGCNPQNNIELPNFIKIVKFINTGTNDGMKRLISYYKSSHFFLMPTLSEAFGHVFCEANAFGLPCISHKTGGIPSVIHNGKNGQLFEIGEDIDNWCNYIIDTFNNKVKYYELCLSSFNEYQTRLNWDVGTKIVYDKLSELL